MATRLARAVRSSPPSPYSWSAAARKTTILQADPRNRWPPQRFSKNASSLDATATESSREHTGHAAPPAVAAAPGLSSPYRTSRRRPRDTKRLHVVSKARPKAITTKRVEDTARPALSSPGSSKCAVSALVRFVAVPRCFGCRSISRALAPSPQVQGDASFRTRGTTTTDGSRGLATTDPGQIHASVDCS